MVSVSVWLSVTGVHITSVVAIRFWHDDNKDL